ncbi:MAG: thiamine diphosphokinase [Agathobacter sp.]|nr:thiamine diphosphokinase [Agathobacter sp.]
MMRFVIISGGHIDDVFALNYLKENKYDCMIAADSGMDFLYQNEIVPDIIAGDFDSVASESLVYFQGLNNVQVMKLNPIKDDTDTEFVIREAIRRGASEITLLGATGTRLDHVLANVNLLGIGLEEGVAIELVDAHNRVRMIKDSIQISKNEQFGSFVSVLPVKGDAKGVTLEGMKYPLNEADVTCFSSLGISNEIVEEVASISVKQGVLLVIESRD